MSFSRLLIHTCTIQQAAMTQEAFGELTETWADLYTGVNCRLVIDTEMDASPDSSQLVLAQYTLLIKGYDQTQITNGMRVTSIVDDDGTTVESGPFEIIAVLPRRGGRGHRHLALKLERRY